ncbi:MAG: glycoside hydrolase family 25 protein [Lachnospiraceae bacterium]|nr:glycoside hydrolase family 25 protein [Lachnospiraceae bacterium]
MKKRKRRKKQKTTHLKFLIVLLILLIAGVYYIQKSSIQVEYGDKVKVIDVSVWNGKINWFKVKNQDIYYAMLRIGRGDTGKDDMTEDTYFGRNYRSGKRYNMRMGVYFYSYATTVEEAREEAEFCVQILKKYNIKSGDLVLPVAYDVEEKSILATGRENVTNLTVAFCERIKEAGYTPMVYSSASYLLRYFKHSEIKNYKIWVAHYGVEQTGPSYPYKYHMWQYSSKGIVPGANTSKRDDKGYCDLNYYIIE